MTPLREQPPYQGYAYAYPHKTAYRPLDPAPSLSEVWAHEDRSALFLYLHVPYCEMRCGFCNLFTTTGTPAEAHSGYLDALERHAEATARALGPATFAQGAVGGGTPTLLSPADLERLFRIAQSAFGVDLRTLGLSVETSPATVDPERLAVLHRFGVSRLSMGVQSFVEAEVRASGRPQRTAEVLRALGHIAEQPFDVLNLDLMYGLPGQTPETWCDSLRRALEYGPRELFLYPLYVRPLTGLDGRATAHDAHRLQLYRLGRDLLRDAGYTQHSMRLFRRDVPATTSRTYRCQSDGMVGLGAGARSYTTDLHYASEWGVGRRRVRDILSDYIGRSTAQHGVADQGIVLSRDEQQRRHIQQSLLCAEGLQRPFYRERFGSDPLQDHPQLKQLVREDLAHDDGDTLRLTDEGMERSDAIGPWLQSPAVQQRMAGFDLR